MPGGKGNIKGHEGNTFSTENQPTSEEKSAGWGKHRTLKKILQIAISNPESFATLKQVKEKLPELELQGITLNNAMDLVIASKALLKGDIAAYNAVKDRAFGKPPQRTELTGKGGTPLFKIDNLSPDELEVLLKLQQKADSGSGAT